MESVYEESQYRLEEYLNQYELVNVKLKAHENQVHDQIDLVRVELDQMEKRLRDKEQTTNNILYQVIDNDHKLVKNSSLLQECKASIDKLAKYNRVIAPKQTCSYIVGAIQKICTTGHMFNKGVEWQEMTFEKLVDNEEELNIMQPEEILSGDFWEEFELPELPERRVEETIQKGGGSNHSVHSRYGKRSNRRFNDSGE